MKRTSGSISRRTSVRWAAAAPALVLVAAAAVYITGRSGNGPFAPRAVAASPTAQNSTLQPFEAVGLPAGRAVGVPAKLTLDAGFTLKHIHGGPTYVYVLSGSFEIVDSDGSRTAYRAGDFFWEAPGHVHTIVVPQGAEVFVLQFLVAGAEATVPVQ